MLKRVPASGHPLLEHLQIQLPVLDAERVPGRAGDQSGRSVPVGEHLAQPGDLHPEHRLRRTIRLITEQLVDQLVAGDDPVGVAQQQREQGPLPGPADPHRRPAGLDLQRPEDPELQASTHRPPSRLPRNRRCRLARGG